MALDKHIGDREYQKFTVDRNDKTAVNTVADIGQTINSDDDLLVADLNVKILLNDILHELRAIRIHQEIITEEVIENGNLD